MKSLRIFKIADGKLAEYVRRHDEIWHEMLELMGEAGIENYTLWNEGREIVEYFETVDAGASARILHESPVKKRWDVFMSDIIEPGERTFELVFEFGGKKDEH